MARGDRTYECETEMPDSDETRELLRKARDGDGRAIEDLFSRHRDRLQRLVYYRMDRRLKARIDPEDVLQETYLDVVRRLPLYLDDGDDRMEFFLWMRFLTQQKLGELHRRHIGAQKRSAGREQSPPDHSSETIAWELAGGMTSPSFAASRAEDAERLRAQLETMDGIDLSVLKLVHFEHLTKSEAAVELGLSVEATRKRYQRALARLREMLGGNM